MICPVERDLNTWIAEGERWDREDREIEAQEAEMLDGIKKKILKLGIPAQWINSIVELMVCSLEDPSSDAGQALFDRLKLDNDEIGLLERIETKAKRAAKKHREANRDYMFDNGDYFNGY